MENMHTDARVQRVEVAEASVTPTDKSPSQAGLSRWRLDCAIYEQHLLQTANKFVLSNSNN